MLRGNSHLHDTLLKLHLFLGRSIQAEKQEILEQLNVKVRLERATIIVNKEIQRIELGEMIQSEVQDEISKTQRDYFLREQLKAIRKELGEDEGTMEMKELEEKIAKSKMTEEARKVARKNWIVCRKFHRHRRNIQCPEPTWIGW